MAEFVFTDGYLQWASALDTATVAKVTSTTLTLNIDTEDITGWADLAHAHIKTLGNHSWAGEMMLNAASPWDDVDTLFGYVASATNTAIVLQPKADGAGTAAANNPTFSFNSPVTGFDISGQVGQVWKVSWSFQISGQVTAAWGGSPANRTF